MAALFGPLAPASALLGDPASYGSAALYSGAPGAPPVFGQAALGRRARPPLNFGGGLIYPPVYPAPPVRIGDSPFASYGPQPAGAGVIGLPTTQADRLFGPFARFGAAPGPGQVPSL